METSEKADIVRVPPGKVSMEKPGRTPEKGGIWAESKDFARKKADIVQVCPEKGGRCPG